MRLRQESDSIKHAAQETREGWDKLKRDRDARFEQPEPDDEEPTE